MFREVWCLMLLGALTVSVTAQTVAPTITTPPQSQTVNPGSSVTFSVVAAGTAPLSYQWEFNGAPMAGATASSLTLNNVDTSVAGTYTVVVSNTGGSVSSAAVLVVNTSPSITSQPANQAVNPGANATFVVQATGSTPLYYQWQLNGTDIPGADGPVLTVTNVQSADAGGYKAVVSNVAGSISSAVAYLTVLTPSGSTPPSITVQPASQEVSINANVEFCATGFGSAPLSYRWLLNGMPLADGGNLSGSASSCLAIVGAQLTNAGTYTLVASNAVGTVASDPAVLLVDEPGGEVDFSNLGFAPVFDVDGVTKLAGAGYLAQLYAGPTANSLVAVGPAVPFYSGDLAGNWSIEPNSVRSVPTVAPGTPVFVQARVWQSGLGLTFEQAAAAGSRTGLSAVLALTAGGASATPGVPPMLPASLTGLSSFSLTSPLAITIQPVSRSVSAGANVTFSVSAFGVAPLSFQWSFDGSPIPGATNSTLTLVAVQQAQAGAYAVTVTNPTGSVTSGTATLSILTPPMISAGPVSQTVLAGTNVTFSVVATGTGTLTYQWVFGATPIFGATNASLILTNVGAAQAGNYSVTVSNGAGSVPSAPATLTVLAPPVIVTQPASQTVAAGATVTFSVTANGSGTLNYQWNFGAAPIPGATSSTLTLTNVQVVQAGSYTVMVSGAGGTVTSAPATLGILEPPTIITGPLSQTAVVGTNVTFTVVANGTAPLTYQWQINGAAILGATSPTLTLNNVQVTQAGNYNVVVRNSAGTVASAAAALTIVVPPTITIPPVTQSAIVGANVTFTVSAVGTGLLSYQWNFNGAAIVGATNASLILTNVQAAQTGGYSATVTNAVGSATSGAATLTVLMLPVITTPPVAQTVAVGATVTFSVVAVGTPTLRYQWQVNGAPIPGATNATLTLSNVQAIEAGNYNVAVSNPAGTTASAAAALTIALPPALFSNPASQTVVAGTNVAFSVGATGTAPLGYQWLFNGAPLAGATSATLILTNVQVAQAGGYSVTLTNAVGSITSGVATLTVLGPPVITSNPTNQTVIAGTNATFGVGATGTAPLSYQWLFNGGPIAGATSATLTLTNVQAAQVGGYSVVVTNLAGRAVSAVATLSLTAPLRFSINPSLANGTFQVTLTGSSGVNVRIDSSTNLVAWQLLTTLTNFAGQAVVSDPQAGKFSQRFYRAVVATPVSASLEFQTNAAYVSGAFQCVLTGGSGIMVRVDFSTNLVDWQPLSTITNFTGQAVVSDPQAAGNPRRFYRAVAGP